MEACFLCGDANRDVESSGIVRFFGKEVLKRAFLWDNDDFFMIPGPGSIMPGYLILATKRHYFRFAELDKNQLCTVQKLVDSISDLGEKLGLENYIFFEHGGCDTGKGGSCINHAHLHLAPCKDAGVIVDSLRKFFQEKEHESLCDIALLKNEDSYIFIKSDKGTFSYITPIIESQYIRKFLALQWDVANQWDWRKYYFSENFKETIRLFERKILL
jgi:hypothetical protein